MTLRLIPPSDKPEESKVEQSLRALRNLPRPPGMLVCKLCGGISSVTVTAGTAIIDGRIKRGTVLAYYECAACWKKGIFSPMIPDVKPLKVLKSTKTKRSKKTK